MRYYRAILRWLEKSKCRNRSRYKFIRAFNHFKYVIICKLENVLIKLVSISDCKLSPSNGVNIVASLTTYPGRINECFYAIKSILLQSTPPNRVVLWLASSQFPEKKLPRKYKLLEFIGVEIRYCEDLRSHKKYFYMLQEQKSNELVITFDDDIIYHPDTVKRAFIKHREYSDAIVCNEAMLISVDWKRTSISPYNSWKTAIDGTKEPDVYKYSILTGSGCLYPYGIMPLETFDKKNVKDIAFTADDLWITFTAKQFGIRVAPTDIMAKPYTTVINSQNTHLAQVNCLGSGNDDTISRILDLYPKLKDKLIKELA